MIKRMIMYVSHSAGFRQDDRESTVPSSAGALSLQQKRLLLSPHEEAVQSIEARRILFRNMSVTTNHVVLLMSQKEPLFDSRSPRTAKRRLTDALKKASYRATAPDFPAIRIRGASVE